MLSSERALVVVMGMRTEKRVRGAGIFEMLLLHLLLPREGPLLPPQASIGYVATGIVGEL